MRDRRLITLIFAKSATSFHSISAADLELLFLLRSLSRDSPPIAQAAIPSSFSPLATISKERNEFVLCGDFCGHTHMRAIVA
jgi:hypothetical protein